MDTHIICNGVFGWGGYMKPKIIQTAIDLLKPIKYEAHETAFFVVMNDEDMGDVYYCENCIDTAVKDARKFHKQKRGLIIESFNKISKGGFYYNGKENIKLTEKEVLKARRYKLREFPAKAKFDYDVGDPYVGGLNEPINCQGCGEDFCCYFEPDIECSERLLEYVLYPLIDSVKWQIEIALGAYEYVEDDVQEILKKVAKAVVSSIGGSKNEN